MCVCVHVCMHACVHDCVSLRERVCVDMDLCLYVCPRHSLLQSSRVVSMVLCCGTQNTPVINVIAFCHRVLNVSHYIDYC